MVKEIASKELMQRVSFVFQDSKLLKMSILDNVRMGRPDATRAEVLQALKDAQRLSIARAMLKNAPILILDEATASLDVDNETLIQESLSRLIRNKTVMIIAHRMRTVADADKIVVLKDGVVAEEGAPKELEAKNGIYNHMIKTQMLSAEWTL